jgi:hypothetical protein
VSSHSSDDYIDDAFTRGRNNFSGVLPLWMLRKNLTGGMNLTLHDGDDNRISLPHDIGSLDGTAIKDELDLSNQGLGGTLPQSLGNLTSLRRLNLSANVFSGSIGPLSTLIGLEELALSCEYGCGDVNGTFAMLSQLTNLRSLDLSGQRVKGSLEPLSGLTQLTSLVLAYSRATTGTIPASFNRLSQLTTLRLQCSNLAGKVPALAVFMRIPDHGQQCELSWDPTKCPYSQHPNHFSCPLPAGAASNCSARCA